MHEGISRMILVFTAPGSTALEYQESQNWLENIESIWLGSHNYYYACENEHSAMSNRLKIVQQTI